MVPATRGGIAGEAVGWMGEEGELSWRISRSWAFSILGDPSP